MRSRQLLKILHDIHVESLLGHKKGGVTMKLNDLISMIETNGIEPDEN